MKKIILLAITSFGIIALAGCGKTSENTNTAVTNTAANGNTAGKANTATTKTEEPAKNVLKPSDVSPDKVFKVHELLDSVGTNGDAWKDKEVTVTGFAGDPESGDPSVLLRSDPNKVDGRVVGCALQGAKAADVVGKTIQVKGKIKKASNLNGNVLIGMQLDPCEVKK